MCLVRVFHLCIICRQQAEKIVMLVDFLYHWQILISSFLFSVRMGRTIQATVERLLAFYKVVYCHTKVSATAC